MAIAGAAILASGLKDQQVDPFLLKRSAIPLVVLATAGLAVLAFRVKGVNEAELQGKLNNALPVQAVETIKQQGWDGPLYNDYGWGGYLIWSLQKPVSMYGRNTVYGVAMVLRSNATWNGYAGWDSDPALLRANLIVAQAGAPLIQLLRLQPCLKSAYRDQVAEVFVPSGSVAGTGYAPSSTFCAARQTVEH
jgi:hypothetical protein